MRSHSGGPGFGEEVPVLDVAAQVCHWAALDKSSSRPLSLARREVRLKSAIERHILAKERKSWKRKDDVSTIGEDEYCVIGGHMYTLRGDAQCYRWCQLLETEVLVVGGKT